MPFPSAWRPLALAALASLAACTSAPDGPVTEAGELVSGDLTLVDGEFQDTYAVRLREGQWLRVDLRSSAFDPFLIVRTPDRQQSENDDVGEDRTRSEVVLQAATAGQYEILATSYAVGETGPYTLEYEVTDTEPARAATTAADAPTNRDEDDAEPGTGSRRTGPNAPRQLPRNGSGEPDPEATDEGDADGGTRI